MHTLLIACVRRFFSSRSLPTHTHTALSVASTHDEHARTHHPVSRGHPSASNESERAGFHSQVGCSRGTGEIEEIDSLSIQGRNQDSGVSGSPSRSQQGGRQETGRTADGETREPQLDSVCAPLCVSTAITVSQVSAELVLG